MNWLLSNLIMQLSVNHMYIRVQDKVSLRKAMLFIRFCLKVKKNRIWTVIGKVSKEKCRLDVNTTEGTREKIMLVLSILKILEYKGCRTKHENLFLLKWSKQTNHKFYSFLQIFWKSKQSYAFGPSLPTPPENDANWSKKTLRIFCICLLIIRKKHSFF